MSTATPSKNTYTGSCHCGNVRFRVAIDPDDPEISKCNCTICHKNGYVFATSAKEEEFELLSPASIDELGSYEFGPKTAYHHFCKTCGVSVFYKSHFDPDSKVNWVRYGVNLLTIDPDQGLDLRKIKFRYWNGIVDEFSTLKDEPGPNGIW